MKIRNLVLIIASVILVTALTVSGTLAYLTASSDTVTNTFTVGNIKITLDEGQTLNGKFTDAGTTRVKENTYKILPGSVFDKDPIVHVAVESEPCYVYVKIADEINGTVANSATINIDTAKWTQVGTNTGIYRYYEIVDASTAAKDCVVFTTLTIYGGVVTSDNIESLKDKTITVKAYAHQAYANGTAIETTTVDAAAISFAW